MAADRSLRIKNIKEKLEFIGCPYVENVEESWLSELLFKPGEPRLRLIEWLLARFDPAVAEMLEGHQARVSILTDSRIGKLLFCSNLLGLCHSDDVDLITAVASKSKQLSFFESLIDMVCIVDTWDRPLRPIDVPATPNWSSRPRTMDDEFTDHCRYVGLLCRQEDFYDTYKEKIQLFPPDVEKKLESGEKRPHVPDMNHLASMATQIGQELEKQTKTLKRYQTDLSPTAESATIDNVSRTMSLTMTTLCQMVEGFINCYETEMSHWSGREKPQLSEHGPVFKRVSLLLKKFTKILVSLETLKLNYLQTIRLESRDEKNNLAEFGTTALSNLQETISILDEAQKR